ncbi:MAG: ferredoxin family protein [Limnohabitans sp.]
MKLPHIETDRCTGCGWCVAACPPKVLSLQRQGWRKQAVLHDEPGCTGCRLCERRCPFDVISMRDPAEMR